MADFYNTDTFSQPAIGPNTATSLGIELAAPSANNTLSTGYSVISESLLDDVDGFVLSVVAMYGSGTTTNLINLYVGAAGQEQLLVGGIQTGRASSTLGAHKLIYLPISIAKGTRLSARQQCSDSAGSSNLYISIIPLYSGFSSSPLSCVSESWGVNYATSKGAAVIASATVNTLGAKTELTASSVFNTKSIALQIHGSPNQISLITLYVGAPGSEVELLGPINVLFDSSSDVSFIYGTVIHLPLSIPAGSRISAAMQSTVANSTAYVSVLAFG